MQDEEDAGLELDDDGDDSNTVRMILDGGNRGPTAGRPPWRLDLSFAPAVDLPTGDPSRPRPAAIRAAPIEMRLDELDALMLTGTREEVHVNMAKLLLPFLADLGGWRA